MTRRVLYVAHPLSPTDEEVEFVQPGHRRLPRMLGEPERESICRKIALEHNVNLALRWLAWLRRSFPQDTFVAPWIATVLSLNGDDGPGLRESGLRDDCAVVERCDGIVMTGSRISSGMRREMEHGVEEHGEEHGIDVGPMPFRVFDLTWLGCREPPVELEMMHGMSLDEYVTWMIGHRADDRRRP